VKIPPPGSDPSGLAEFVDLLVRESEQAPNRIAWINDAARNYDLYLGDHWMSAAPTDQIRLVLNRIQNCIVSLVAVQAGDPPKVTFTPRETGDPPLVYLNTNIPEAQQYAAEMVSAGVDPAQPLPPEVAQQLKAEVESAEIVRARAAGMGQAPPPNLPPDELIVEITDATTSQALQTMFDAAWEEADAQSVFVENILHKNIFGWQPTLVEFLDDEKRHQLTNVHGFQVFPDPIHADPRRWGYVTAAEQPQPADPVLARLRPGRGPRTSASKACRWRSTAVSRPSRSRSRPTTPTRRSCPAERGRPAGQVAAEGAEQARRSGSPSPTS
jgi:hypothetical protein